jgi:hypothetical protein
VTVPKAQAIYQWGLAQECVHVMLLASKAYPTYSTYR